MLTRSTVSTPNGAKASPEKSQSESLLVGASSPWKDQTKRKAGRKKKRSPDSEDLDEDCAKTTSDLSLSKDGPVDHLSEEEASGKTLDIWEILSWSSALPAPLSPLPPDELVIIL